MLSDPMDCSPPGSSVHGIFQARVLEWGAIAFSAATPGSYIFISSKLCLKITKIVRSEKCIFNITVPFSVQFSAVAQSCLILCDPMDCSPPGSSIQEKTIGHCALSLKT